MPIATISQILIVEDGGLPDPLPPQVRRNIDSVRLHHPEAAYRLWGGEELRGFLAAEFPPGVLGAYDTLRPYAYKADLARACLLFHFGGMYCDIGHFFLRPWLIPPGCALAAFRDLGDFGGVPYLVQNGLIFAEPELAEMQTLIGRIVEHCRTHFYGDNPLFPTGPALFGQVIAASPSLRRYDIGACRAITPEFPNANPCFVDRAGRLVAVRMKERDNDIGHLGLSGTNSYDRIWHEHSVYGESERVFAFDDPRWQFPGGEMDTGGVEFRPDRTGYLMFGPYLPLPAGSWRARLHFAPASVRGTPEWDVCGDQGRTIFARGNGESPDASGVLTLDFVLPGPCANVEMRLVGNGFGGRFLRMDLAPVPPPTGGKIN